MDDYRKKRDERLAIINKAWHTKMMEYNYNRNDNVCTNREIENLIIKRN